VTTRRPHGCLVQQGAHVPDPFGEEILGQSALGPSCGSARVTAPVSAGSVSTRMAASSAAGSCSGRLIRSQ
jgi:hypothetical protein